MNALKSIFSWLGRFLEKARTVMLNLGTAFVLIFFTIIIIGAFTSSGPEVKDPSGRVPLLILLELWLIKRYLTQIFCLNLALTHQWIKFKQEILFN